MTSFYNSNYENKIKDEYRISQFEFSFAKRYSRLDKSAIIVCNIDIADSSILFDSHTTRVLCTYFMREYLRGSVEVNLHR